MDTHASGYTRRQFVGMAASEDPLRLKIADSYRLDETAAVESLLKRAPLGNVEATNIFRRARRLVVEARKRSDDIGGLDAFLSEYALSSQEGVILMCLAEALLRIPDDETRDRMIRDKLANADWESHFGHSNSILVNASTLGSLLTGQIVRLDADVQDIPSFLSRLVSRTGEPVIRAAIVQAIRILGRQFVMGRTINEALKRAGTGRNKAYRYSFDMLGEAALTQNDAERYVDAYAAAIETVGKAAGGKGPYAAPGISIKLSALHPRYCYAQRDRVLRELVPRLVGLVELARDAGIGLTIDAEEAERLDLSLDVIEAVVHRMGPTPWQGFGLAVQAYQKRALGVIDWVVALAQKSGWRINVRLVKGAYWDSEIKRAQELGLESYPVYTRKASTDVSYIACARMLFDSGHYLYPQFATHNAHTVAAVRTLAPKTADFEFQRLHGMGEALYGLMVGEDVAEPVDCRVYAPVGSHEELLPYLVRRLLENGANTSFVNRLADSGQTINDVIADPVAKTAARQVKPHPKIPLPTDIFAGDRQSAIGIDLSDPLSLAALGDAMERAISGGRRAWPQIDGNGPAGQGREVFDPADRRRVIGAVVEVMPGDVDTALNSATAASSDWDRRGGTARAAILDRTADLMEHAMPELMAIAVREGGKTLPDAVAEVREAVDFCRYYGTGARRDFERCALPGPTGEANSLEQHGRGVFACISPWNFPIAIFTGQVAAALAAGNGVVAKPAEQTPLAAAAVIRLFHEAGVPPEILHCLPGDGAIIGGALVADPRISGVTFTGSTEIARLINGVLAARPGPIVPLIAETGGQNAMIVDSSALPEQVVKDVIASAFLSAGQRCSALRVLFLQEETADRIITMLSGAMQELVIGDPALLSTDIGPVIDGDACAVLQAHADRMAEIGKLIYRCSLDPDTANGSFFAPVAFEIDHLGLLEREVFGPILHVIRYKASKLDAVIDAINGTGYGLTAGIHSRIDETIDYVCSRLRVGNTYVNRSMVGAVVGVQPFGGEGISGTGPKAGGPHYLHRFAVERALSVNTSAVGGNATLLSLGSEE
jgi:RHH-type proline utilization regulon transcriptional repressor/proline dehydrogenase/delta 1-pyrroline-5-carboxylate dehydrogenase